MTRAAAEALLGGGPELAAAAAAADDGRPPRGDWAAVVAPAFDAGALEMLRQLTVTSGGQAELTLILNRWLRLNRPGPAALVQEALGCVPSNPQKLRAAWGAVLLGTLQRTIKFTLDAADGVVRTPLSGRAPPQETNPRS